MSETVRTSTTNAVDIIFVVDTSASMDRERAALGQRLSSFLGGLQGLDWQVCLTTTDVGAVKGKMLLFGNGMKVLKSSVANVGQVFLDTLVGLPSGSGDERGVAALYSAVALNDTDCIRSGAALSAVILSDEDERSTGGYQMFESNSQYRALEYKDYPANLVTAVSDVFGRNKVFTSHSIVIKSSDVSCYNTQDKDSNVFYGTRYEELSGLTAGRIGNICAADYGQQLGEMGGVVNASLASVTLQCSPPEKPTVTGTTSSVSWSGNKLFFTPALPAGSSVGLSYRCKN